MGESIWDIDPITNGVDCILSQHHATDNATEQHKLDTLHLLLCCEELLQEVKEQHKELIEFICCEEVMLGLIKFTQVAQSGDEESVEVSYSAIEVFCCQVTSILDFVLGSKKCLQQVFSVLDRPAPLDSRVAGFFYKLLSVLTHRNAHLIMVLSVNPEQNTTPTVPPTPPSTTTIQDNTITEGDAVVAKHGDIGWLLPKLLKHLESYSICLCIKVLLKNASEKTYEENKSDMMRHACSVWLGGHGAALSILNALSTHTNSDFHSNAAEILAELVQRAALARLLMQADPVENIPTPSNNNSAAGGSSSEGGGGASATAMGQSDESNGRGYEDGLPRFKGMVLVAKGKESDSLIESGIEWTVPLVNNLLELSFSASNVSNSCLQVLCNVVSAFALERWGVSSAGLTCYEAHGEIPTEIQLIIDKLDYLCDALAHGSSTLLQTQFGGTVQRLGIHRLKLAELLCLLLHSKYPEVLRKIAFSDKKPLALLLELFFQFEWNNLLHDLVEKMVGLIMTGGVSEETLGYHEQVGGHNGSENEREDELEREQAIASKALLELQYALLKDCSLLDRLLEEYKNNVEAVQDSDQYWNIRFTNRETKAADEDIPYRRHGQKGNMGYCHNIANLITSTAAAQAIAKQKRLREGLVTAESDFPVLFLTEQNESWNNLVNGELNDVNAVQNFLLGGFRPAVSFQDSNSLLNTQIDPDVGETEEDFGSSAQFPAFTEELDSINNTFSNFSLQPPTASSSTNDATLGADGAADVGGVRHGDTIEESAQEAILESVDYGEQSGVFNPFGDDDDDDDDDDGFDELVKSRHPVPSLGTWVAEFEDAPQPETQTTPPNTTSEKQDSPNAKDGEKDNNTVLASLD